MYLVGGFTAGKRIIWHAGASGVSIAGIQLSVAGGAEAVYATASSQEKIEFCTQTLGATAGINYKNEDFAQKTKELTEGYGVDIIVDFVGQSHLQKNLDCLAKDGTIVALASLSGTVVKELDISAFVRKRASIKGSSLRSRDEAYQTRLCETFVRETLPLLESRKLELFIEAVYPWERIIEAHKRMESNESRGKIICTI
jgi:NADPH:quinone reductase-like Zn-dependent oxidoreductase